MGELARPLLGLASLALLLGGCAQMGLRQTAQEYDAQWMAVQARQALAADPELAQAGIRVVVNPGGWVELRDVPQDAAVEAQALRLARQLPGVQDARIVR